MVMPVVRCSDAASATVTRSFTPSKVRAPPTLPAVVQVGPPDRVPLLFDPDRSLATVPVPSSNPKEATRPGGTVGGGGAVLDTVTVTGAEVSELPVGSRATAVSVAGPLAA